MHSFRNSRPLDAISLPDLMTQIGKADPANCIELAREIGNRARILNKTIPDEGSIEYTNLDLLRSPETLERLVKTGLGSPEDFRETLLGQRPLEMKQALELVRCIAAIGGSSGEAMFKSIKKLTQETLRANFDGIDSIPEHIAPFVRLMGGEDLFKEPQIVREELGPTKFSMKISGKSAEVVVYTTNRIDVSIDGPAIATQVLEMTEGEDLTLRNHSFVLRQPSPATMLDDAQGPRHELRIGKITRNGTAPTVRFSPPIYPEQEMKLAA